MKKVKKATKKECKTTYKEDKIRQHTSVSYPIALYERLQRSTEVLERTRNNIVNLAVKEYLDSYEIK